MNKILSTITLALCFASCDTTPQSSEVFVRQDLLGEWTVSQVAYSGEMPNPLNPSALMQFSGLGSQLVGEVNIYEMPDSGNIAFRF